MITSLLYVSRSALGPEAQAAQVDAIVRTALRRNPALGVTGALMFTGRNFAQYLEGPAEAVADLMARIRSDPRHDKVDIVVETAIAARRFPVWAMAYAGPSTFVDANVLPLTDPVAPALKRKAAERLIRLMRQFVEAHRIAEQRETNRAG